MKSHTQRSDSAPKPSLNASQRAAFEKILALSPGEFVFLTGEAGTGKSFLVRYLSEHLNPILTASTGLAAVNVGGVTCHSFFGLNIGIYTPVTPPRMKKEAQDVLKQSEYIVIDECSMLRSDTVDAIDDACRRATGTNLRFGGKKVIFVGDVFQLPPIVTQSEKDIFFEKYQSEWFFDSWVIDRNIPVISLEEPMRQLDSEMLEALNHIRYGRVSGLPYFNQKAYTIPSKDAVRIVGKNDVARAENLTQLEKLKGKAKTYFAEFSGDFRETEAVVDPEVKLKVGAKVILCKNQDDAKNGQVGIVEHLFDDFVMVLIDGKSICVEQTKWEKVRYEVNEETNGVDRVTTGTFKQIPLKLGYAITVHKAQGQTYDQAHIDLAYTFTPGQLYVALSRCKTIEGLTIEGELRNKALKACDHVISFFAEVKG